MPAHPVFVTKYRRPVFIGPMLTDCEQLMPTRCANLDAQLPQFNGETDLVHLLVLTTTPRAIGVG